MKKNLIEDPFEKEREEKGIGEMNDQNDQVTMVLRHRDVRKCAHNWKDYTSAAKPGRIVIPSEVNIRETRQIPFELDPPKHGQYRKVIEEWFRRPLKEDYQEKLKSQIELLLDEVIDLEQVELVHDFALKLQSRALTLLLNTPFEESETWISWGTHVFRSEGEALDGDKANILYDYIDKEIKRAELNPTDDLYSMLLASAVEGKKLTHEEIKGVLVLTFAGGRDTVINAVTNTIAYFAEHPESLTHIKEEPEIVGKAVEELLRYFSPLTQIGRVVKTDSHICEHAVKADTRIGLCWASANRDAQVFENPNEIDLTRKMNPHVAFGFGTHNCLGASHARQILRILVLAIASKVESIEVLDGEENIEELGVFRRKVGYHNLNVAFNKIENK
ncbi:cytochrome P450 [Portibacter lacus]|uniref:Cytochrome P450 YjiB n=1 Tax=Portibacter lacus TaxID=1099794 RepID=A0AA37SRU7_9BACT|nr:cytochrome P450 [Portibacter lacus]GLR16835.1 putative cytochrome P450 YjiB [Portibacter lacus]